jgi:hypothetical protein
VTVADPVRLAPVAMIVTDSSLFFAVTRAVFCPVLVTVATSVLSEIHPNVTPLTGLPAASRAWAVSVVVVFRGIDTVDGVMRTVATGPGVTVMVEVPLLPPAVAVIVAVPTSPPVTTPVLDTVATVASLVVHVTG